MDRGEKRLDVFGSNISLQDLLSVLIETEREKDG
jgi:hypothetical protein